MDSAETLKSAIIKKYRAHGKDTGSPEVQIALLSGRINDLGKHFEVHQKDHSSRRGMLKLVVARRRLLDYVKKYRFERYTQLLEELGIRK